MKTCISRLLLLLRDLRNTQLSRSQCWLIFWRRNA